MFRTINRLTQACECLTSSIEALRDMVGNHQDFLAGQPNVEARLEEMERSRALFEAEVHGELLKAKTEYQKASSAEMRAKKVAKTPTSLEDDDETPAEFQARYREWLAEANGEAAADAEAAAAVTPGAPAAGSVVDSLRAQKRGR